MSLPSLVEMVRDVDLNRCSDRELNDLVFAAMKKDLPLACEYLHTLSHGNGTVAIEDPKSELGRQLIRVCGSDTMRPLAEARLCHGKHITFYNCCGVQVSERKPKKRAITLTQIRAQAGPIAYADC